MKKILSICLVAALMFGLGSCSKEAPNQGGNNPFYVPSGGSDPTGGGGGDPEPTPSSPVGDVPDNFTKKIIIEKMTGEWCGACPSGGTKIEAIATANPGQVFPAAWQMSNGDPFEIPAAKIWRQHITAGAGISSYGFPSASINRAACIGTKYVGAALDQSSTDWTTQSNTELAKTAECGLALVTSEADDKVDVDVYVGFNNAITTANTHVTVFLIENDVPESSVGAQSGAPDGYKHKHMIRDVLTADLGDIVDLSTVTADKFVKLELKGLSIAGKYNDKNNLSILAFVNIKGSTGDQLGVLNAQEVHLGETKKFD